MRAQFLKLHSKIAAFPAERSGATAILFALSLVPIMGLTGVAIDHASAMQSQTALQGVADSAALYSVSDQVIKPSTPWQSQKAEALKAAKSDFEGQIAALGLGHLGVSATYDVDIASNGQVTSKVCYKASKKTMMMQVLGVPNVEFASCATSTSAPPVYAAVYALVDASSSMGIGASDSDRFLMKQRLGCVFACHTVDWNSNADCRAGDWYSWTTTCAHQIGAVTRFDVVRNALTKVADQAQTIAKAPGQYSIAIYKFSNYLTKVQDLTTNMASVKSTLAGMKPDGPGSGTNFKHNIQQFTRDLPASGDGKSPGNPKVFVMILTDGMGSQVYERPACYFDRNQPCNYYGSWDQDPNFVNEGPSFNGGVISTAFQSKHCKQIKDKGITLLTLETEFNASNSGDGHMMAVDTNLRPTVHSELQKCASASSLAFAANQGTDVDKAIQTMFSTQVEKARLTK